MIVGLLAVTRGMGEIKKIEINDVDLQAIEDGVYQGSFTAGRFGNKVEVTVRQGQIAEIVLLEGSQTDLMNNVLARVKKAQSLQIDMVSGATVTTKAILKAVENALTQADH